MPRGPWLPPALTKPRYRIYAVGMGISLMGYWVQTIALSWLVYRLTDSVFILGLAGFMQQIPSLVVPPIAGMLADRLPRVKLVLILNLVLGLLALTLAILVWSGVKDVRIYLAMAFLTGCVAASEAPNRQSLVGAIVEEPALLPSAIAFHSVIFNTGRMVGPTVAGLLLLVMSEAWCFFINAISYVAVLIAFRMIGLKDGARAKSQESFIAMLRSTAARVGELPVARYFLPLVATAGLLAAPYQALMPSYVDDVLGGGTGTLGLLVGAAGAGALSAAIYLSLQTGGRAQLRLVQLAPFSLGLAVIGFGLSRSLPLSCLCLYAIGASIMCTTATTNTLLQLSVDPGWRARVIGIFQMSFAGVNPVGSLIAGLVAARLGIGPTFVLNGALILLVGLLMRWRLKRSPDAARELERVVGG
ncbi:MAG TPA: MFS transporter [Hyphomicrobiaceae bacterium]|nr:MFS transporter [Hyphomicrobiaceae bacterium]